MKPPIMILALLVAAVGATAVTTAAPVGAKTFVNGVLRADVRDLGPASPRLPVSFTLALRYRHEAELDRLVEAQGDPTSPLYRQYLTNQQFNAYFAPTDRDYERVLQSLRAAGFGVERSDNRTIVKARGSALAAQRYFGARIHRIVQAGYGERYANVHVAVIPSAIADITRDVVGLDNLHAATTDHFFTTNRDVRPAILKNILNGPNGGYGPFAIAQAYDYPVQHKFDGTGHAVAIAIDYDTSDTDLTTYTQYFKINRKGKLIHVPIDGGQPYSPSGSVESTLDMETVAGLDPGADVYIYNFGAAFSFQEISDAYNQAVSDNFVDEVSSSFGLCEDNSPSSFNDAVNSITKQGAAKGIGFNASTGDFGRGGKCNDGTGQDVPASLKYFISVGGSDPSIDSNGNLTSEHEDSGSGGGPSDIFPLPKYQVGLAGEFSTTNRNLPDVSGPYQPDAFFENGRWGTIGGTSWASPATAAFIAEANQVEHKRLGFPNPKIYRVFKANQYTLFNDVTVGNNGIACGTGYDDCSGIGTLKAFALAGAL